MNVKVNDNVLVLTGKYKGKQGKVLATYPKANKVVVEGVNLVHKHEKARKANDTSKIVTEEAPIDVSNVEVVCDKCGKAKYASAKSAGHRSTKRSSRSPRQKLSRRKRRKRLRRERESAARRQPKRLPQKRRPQSSRASRQKKRPRRQRESARQRPSRASPLIRIIKADG